MTIDEFKAKFLGKVVTATAAIEELDTELDEGMMGIVREVRDKYEDMFTVVIDAGGIFLEYNKSKASASYYDKSGNPILDAWEAGFWPSNNRVLVYISTGSPDYFTTDVTVFTAAQIPQQVESKLWDDEQLDQLIIAACRLGLTSAARWVTGMRTKSRNENDDGHQGYRSSNSDALI